MPSDPPRRRPRISTTALTVANIGALIVSGFVFAFADPSFPAILQPLVIAFPTVAALFEVPQLWAGILLVAIVISGLSTRRTPGEPWWPRFYRRLAWCGIATVPLGWVVSGGLAAAALIFGIS